MPTSNNAAVLVGNGLSIAFNPELNLRSITQEVLRRIQEEDGDDVIAAMKELAERALPEGATSESDFELLVGAFGAESRAMSILAALARLTSPQDDDLKVAIDRVASFASDVRDRGVSHVLEVIAERSTAHVPQAAGLHDLVSALVDAFDGKVVIGNLNYDTLLLAALLHVCGPRKVPVSDLGHGWKDVNILVNDVAEAARALRESKDDFPPTWKILLLHLHGSLTYWATPDGSVHAKLPKRHLEDGTQWQAVRDKTTNVRPTVVLANQHDKEALVGEYPFSLAYEMFRDGLCEADRWIIVGYSFRDLAVNDVLRDTFLAQDPKPRVLVVTAGDDPSRTTVERAFGWGAEDGDSSGWLTINRGGADGAQNSDDWARFTA